MIIRETKYVKMKNFETITISNLPNLPDSYKNWLLITYQGQLYGNSFVMELTFDSNLIYGCQIWGQDQNEEFKKIEKLPEKVLRFMDNKFPSLKYSSWKTDVWNEYTDLELSRCKLQ